MTFRSGWAAVQEAAERIAEKRGSLRDRMITWNKEGEDGNTHIIRLLDEGPIVVGIHSQIECKDGRARTFTCATELDENRACYICENMTRETSDGSVIPVEPRVVGLGMVALRQEVREDGETRIVDVPVDVKIDPTDLDLVERLESLGVTVAGDKALGVPDIGIVRQSVGNFWGSFNAYYARYGSATDRDYTVTRTGEGYDTTYLAVANDPDEALQDPDDLARHYEASRLLRTSVIEYLERMGSEERYERYLIPGEGDTPEAQAFARGRTLADLRAELRGDSVTDAETDATPADPAPTPAKDEPAYESLLDRLTRLSPDAN